MPSVITLKNVRVKQGGSFCLSVESLVLKQGLVYALTGPNGAGKSTLLRVMALLAEPHSGSIEFASNGTEDVIRLRQKVTLVEQSPYLFKGTVADNLSYGLKLRGVGHDEGKNRIQATLKDVGLEGFEQRQAEELSGGEIQRVALARALVLKPELLLLDEPTANIDSNSLQAYEELLRRLPQYGVTVVFSTHDPSQSRRLGEKVLRIENGRVLTDKQIKASDMTLSKRRVMHGT